MIPAEKTQQSGAGNNDKIPAEYQGQHPTADQVDYRQHHKQGHQHDFIRHRIKEDTCSISHLEFSRGKSIQPVRDTGNQHDAKRFPESAP